MSLFEEAVCPRCPCFPSRAWEFYLASYDWIVVNSSAGKDSQAMLDYVCEKARDEGVLDRVVVLHCDLGLSPGGQEIEWPGTKELAREHADHYGLRFIMVKRGKRGFIEEVLDRGAFPSSAQRYCTSYYKREQGLKVLVHLANETRSPEKRVPRLLNCFGFRAEESTRRRKLVAFGPNKYANNSRKHVDDWLPIHGWKEGQVWERIKQAGTRPHPAYAQGMKRLSCRFCIFAPKGQLMLSAKLNPELFKEYLEVEKEIGHRFTLKLSLAEVDEALRCGERPPEDDGKWNM